MNHLAFHAGSRAAVDAIVEEAAEHGWHLMLADDHPWAGRPDHCTAYLEDAEGREVGLVAEMVAGVGHFQP